jgi:hypothetical protein
VYEAWEEKQAIEDKKTEEKKAAKAAIGAPRDRDKGKAATPIATPRGFLEMFGSDKAKAKDAGLEKGAAGLAEGTEAGEDENPRTAGESSAGRRREGLLGPLVVLACRHIYHQSCLDVLQVQKGEAQRTVDDYGRELREYRCPIDG